MATLNIHISNKSNTQISEHQIQRTESIATKSANNTITTTSASVGTSNGNFNARQNLMIGTMFVSQMLDYGTSNYGKMTGNVSMQRNINKVKELIGYSVGFAVAPILTTISLATNIATTLIDNWTDQHFNELELNNAILRAGSNVGRKL